MREIYLEQKAPADALAYGEIPRPSPARGEVLVQVRAAAVIPISALTAWQGLLERAQLERGQRVLIHGAAGAVGSFAVQVARRRGAQVVATASAKNLDYVRELGAAEVVDYRATRFEKAAASVDVVFDTVGGETLARSWSVVRKGGRVITVSSASDGFPDQRSRDAFLLVRADGSQLSEIGRLLDAGILHAAPAAVYPLAQAREAYASAECGGLRGKIALQVIE